MSDIPETDAARRECLQCGGFWFSIENARKMERERDEARMIAERDNADAARFRWLLSQGLAWQGCYESDDKWQECE